MYVHRNLEALPYAVCLLAPITFCLTFILAVKWGHVSTLLPYISYTGEIPPEKCWFSQLLNITAFLLSICVYIRFLLVSTASVEKFTLHNRLNHLAAFFGFLSCFGMSMVANFQVNNIPSVHYVGAFFCFVGGNIYFVLQTVFSYRLNYIGYNKDVLIFRLLLCIVALILNFTTVVTGIASRRHFRGIDASHWNLNDEGYLWHVSSAAAEWLLTFTHSALVLTFFPEFKAVQIKSPIIKIDSLYMMLDNEYENQDEKILLSDEHLHKCTTK